MSPERESAEALLERAEAEARALRALVGVDEVDDIEVGFLCQRVIEKALKAVLASRGIDYELTHDLAALQAALDEPGVVVTVEALGAPSLGDLSEFAGRPRYNAEVAPPLDREPAAALAAACVAEARALVDEVE